MDESRVRAIIQEELKDINKILNRIYEDREDISNIKTRLGTVEDLYKQVLEYLKKFGKNITADIADMHSEVKEVSKALTE